MIIFIMTAKVLYFNVFSQKDPHLNAVEQRITHKIFDTNPSFQVT